MSPPSLPAIYSRYETLSRLARDRFAGLLAGRLLLRLNLDAEGLTAVVAASIAGACSLCIEPEAEVARAALRAGLCDFVVGPLDEALRILKNELRRGLAVSVGLTAKPESVLAEMIERGLQPDLLSLPGGEPSQIFVDRGALILPQHDSPDLATALLEWTVATDAARLMPQIARIAVQALDASRSDTPLRQRWLEAAPRYLGRAFAASHCVRMTAEESAAFIAAARSQFPAIQLSRDAVEI
jgi:hypothetical protein